MRAAVARRLGLIRPPAEIADLGPAHFWACAGQPFRIELESGSYALRLQDVSVRRFGGPTRQHQFSVILTGDDPGPNLSQLCRVTHSWLGDRDLFVNRIQPKRPDDPPVYEISFT